MKKVGMSLPAQMAVGMVLGIVVGAVAQVVNFDTETWLRPLGQLFISLIRMVVVPLVLATIVAGAAGIHDLSKLGRVAGKTLIYYFATTAVAVAIGLILGGIFQPGLGLEHAPVQAPQIKGPPSIIDILLGIVPVNPLDALARGNMLQVIFFAVMFGFALSSLGERGHPLLQFFELLGDTMVRLTNIIMLYAPIGVFGLMAHTVSQHGIQVLLPLAKLILVMYLAALVHVLIVYLPLVKFVVGISPVKFMQGISEPFLVAFTTCSSAAAIPANLQSVRRLGASKGVSSFSIPLGNTINMDGTAIYMGVAAIFAAGVYGMPLSFGDQLSVLLIGLLASVGTAGVPGSGLIMVSMVFTQVNIPLEAVALIAGIDRILDMARTTLNVMGDATGALLVSRLEGDLDKDPYSAGEETQILDTGTEPFTETLSK